MCLKFGVVKFYAASTYGTNPYKIVPLKWVQDIYGNEVLVQYPSKDEVFTDFKYIVECKPPLPIWEIYCGTLQHVTSKLFCNDYLFHIRHYLDLKNFLIIKEPSIGNL